MVLQLLVKILFLGTSVITFKVPFFKNIQREVILHPLNMYVSDSKYIIGAIFPLHVDIQSQPQFSEPLSCIKQFSRSFYTHHTSFRITFAHGTSLTILKNIECSFNNLEYSFLRQLAAPLFHKIFQNLKLWKLIPHVKALY